MEQGAEQARPGATEALPQHVLQHILKPGSGPTEGI